MQVVTFYSFQRFADGELFALLPCMVLNERRTTMTQPAALEIVWRNPKPPQRHQRWKQDSGTAHYLVQELVSTLLGSFWATTSTLEIFPGGRAA